MENLYTRPAQRRPAFAQDRPLPEEPPPDPPPPDPPRDTTEWMTIGEVQTLQAPGGSSLHTAPGLADEVDGHPSIPDVSTNVMTHGSQRWSLLCLSSAL